MLADSGKGSQGFHSLVGERRASDMAPRLPVTGTSSVSPFNEKLQVDLRSSGDTTALRATDMYSEYSLPALLPSVGRGFQFWDTRGYPDGRGI